MDLSGSNDYSYFRTWSSNASTWEKMVHRVHGGTAGRLGVNTEPLLCNSAKIFMPWCKTWGRGESNPVPSSV